MHGLRGCLRVSAVVLFSVLVAPVAPTQAQTLTVFAAASMADALGEILRHYDPGRGTRIVASYGASSTLSRQIERGAPADVFVSADQAWMDYLAKAARVEPATRTVLVANRLVLIAHATSTARIDIVPGFALPKLLGNSRLAMGDPMHVPAGRYAKAALTSLGVWNLVEHKVAAAENVRAALNYVARGETTLGIVYESDVMKSAVRVAGVFPAASHPPIEFPAAMTTAARQPEAARRLLGYLRSSEAREVFVRYGFTPTR